MRNELMRYKAKIRIFFADLWSYGQNYAKKYRSFYNYCTFH
ncbi:hypothetical protein [Croceivirga sp. JEA036]|nr:hypothetical protein [Croceivirga sp. JEA036]